jgi:transposase
MRSRRDEVEAVLADKAYDANTFIEWLAQRDIETVIPPRKNRKQAWEYDKHRYGERHLVECFFNKIKRFRRIFTHYEKLLRHYFCLFGGNPHLAQMKCPHVLGSGSLKCTVIERAIAP